MQRDRWHVSLPIRRPDDPRDCPDCGRLAFTFRVDYELGGGYAYGIGAVACPACNLAVIDPWDDARVDATGIRDAVAGGPGMSGLRVRIGPKSP